MFHNIPQAVLVRMAYLEKIDARDRLDGTAQPQRLRQIPPETGKYLALQAANTPTGEMIEIGTSAGYSALWIWLACRLRGHKLTTFEVLEEKVRLAQETFQSAEIEDQIHLVHGDARQHLASMRNITFCFLDAEKSIYQDCYDLVIQNMTSGGLFVADNAINHQEILAPFIQHAEADERVDSMVVAVGKGLLVCRKT